LLQGAAHFLYTSLGDRDICEHFGAYRSVELSRFRHSRRYSLTHSLTGLLTHSLTHSPTHSPTHSLLLFKGVTKCVRCAVTRTGSRVRITAANGYFSWSTWVRTRLQILRMYRCVNVAVLTATTRDFACVPLQVAIFSTPRSATLTRCTGCSITVTHSLTHLLTHSLTHLLTQSLTYRPYRLYRGRQRQIRDYRRRACFGLRTRPGVDGGSTGLRGCRAIPAEGFARNKGVR
jgi:hypothetical protein